jgi:hypothetical protein
LDIEDVVVELKQFDPDGNPGDGSREAVIAKRVQIIRAYDLEPDKVGVYREVITIERVDLADMEELIL